ncbi:MAG: purine-binding chemotaxis protein CheW [Deltaproteobacteria bacterium]|nr:purine-binding chemotaxis protein CheW [Deltaproteobacteria bacterium]
MEDIIQLAAFRVGDERYVIDIMRIREIINPTKITAVPYADGVIEGVVNLRSVIIPIVDLRKRLGLSPRANTRQTKFIIASVESRVYGFRVDEVLEVVRVPRSSIEPSPRLESEEEPGLFLGVCRYEDQLLLLLNLKKVIRPR